MKKAAAILFVMFISMSLPSRSGMGLDGGWRVPEPRLVRPASEFVDLIGKDSLEFKWLTNPPVYVPRQFYDFRLYKGYQMVESALMYKEKLPARSYNVILKSGMLENGQVYTWALRNIFGAGKSNWVHISFKVKK